MASRDAIPGIGALLIAARESARLTLRDAGEAAKVSFQNLGMYEREEKTPSVAVLRRIAAAYGVTLNDLVPEPEKPKKSK